MTFEQFLQFLVPLLYRFKFVFELMIACGLYAFFLPKRNKFALRLVCCIVVIFGLSACWNPESSLPLALSIVKYLSLFIFVLIAIHICFRTSVWTVLFCGTGGYILQHLSYRVVTLASYGYERIIPDAPAAYLMFGVIWLAVYAVFYVTIFFLFARRIKMNDEVCVKNKNIIFVCLATVLCVVVLSLGFDSYSEGLSSAIYIICNLCFVVICLFLFFMLYIIFKNKSLQNDADTLERMMHMKEEQYVTSQKTIDIINVKCHDMKHQLALLQGKEGSEYISELEKTISIYDTAVKTGNSALDIVLAEKGLLCQQENIRFTFMGGGEKLGFMSDADIYSLFANALDNAITAVRNLQDEGKRVINISVKNSLGLVAVHIENYFDDKLEFDGELPVTTKSDKNYHGYGLKSIKMTVEKYGGCMSIGTQDGLFKLNISVPLPNDNL